MKKHILSLAVASLFAAPAVADIRIDGFANLVGGITSSEDSVQGYDDTINFSEDSAFALQFSSDIGDRMTATAQFIARGNDNYDVDMEWAYLTYEASDALSISAGRLRAPLFTYSASLDVGYSYHWITAPASVYEVPFKNVDGIRVNYAGFSGDLEYNFQVVAGNQDSDFELVGQTASFKADNVVAVTAEALYNGFKVRGIAGGAETTLESPALTPVIAQLAAVTPSLADLLAVNEDDGRFYGIGVEYDTFDWFIAGEYTLVTLEDSFYPDEKNAYVTAGFRIGQWTPFATVEHADRNDGVKFLDQVAALPAVLQAPVSAGVIGSQLAVTTESYTYSVGVRYDLEPGIALKADLTRVDDRLNDDADAGLLRFAVNYVF